MSTSTTQNRTIYRSFYKAASRAVQRWYNGIHQGRFEPRSVQVEAVRLDLPSLEPQFDGYRIVQISDIHIGTWINRERLEGVVALVNQQSPDLVVITGDFVTFDPHDFVADLISSLRQLQPRDATLAVLGNHDHWTDPQIVRDVISAANIIELSNAVFTLGRDGAALHVAGVDDIMEGLDRLELVLRQMPAEGTAILLAHEPDFADISAASGRFDLQLSGHTHGGQVVLPYLGAPLLPRLGRKYPSGFYQINGMAHYTNRGVGTAAMQLRVNCPPEITVLTLHSHRYRLQV